MLFCEGSPIDNGRNTRMHSGLRYETIVSTSILLNASTTASAVLLRGDTVAMVIVISIWEFVQL